MSAGREPEYRDVPLYAGDTLLLVIRITDLETQVPVDTTKGTWIAQVKPVNSNELLHEFTVTPDTNGRIHLLLDAEKSESLYGYPEVRWDLQQTFDDGVVFTYVRGLLVITKDVSRAVAS